MKTLLCFHGSPGAVEDFNQLSERLPNWNVVAVQRDTIPKSVDDAVVLGYSWGAVEALLWLGSISEKPEALILVSPYLRAKPRGLGGFIFNTAIIGPLVWHLLGNRITESFLQKTAAPAVVDKEYRRTYSSIMTCRTLARALNEKVIPREMVKDALLKTKDVSLLIVRGGSDIVSDANEDVALIRDARGVAQIDEVIIPDAGHALVWTHVDELVKILRKYE